MWIFESRKGQNHYWSFSISFIYFFTVIHSVEASNQWWKDTLVIYNPNPFLSWATLTLELKGQAWIWVTAQNMCTRSWNEGMSKYDWAMFQWRSNFAHTIWIWEQKSLYQALDSRLFSCCPNSSEPVWTVVVVVLRWQEQHPCDIPLLSVAHLCLETFHLNQYLLDTVSAWTSHWPLTLDINKSF